MLQKIIIRNYRCFESLDMQFNRGANILVGDNEAGKSTLLEAVNLVLTGRLNGRPLQQELTPYLINLQATDGYLADLKGGLTPSPPELIIDLFLEEREDLSILRGTNNLTNEDAVGIRIRAAISSDFQDEYEAFVADPASVRLVPTEYYVVDWLGFSGNRITYRSVPATISLIDASSIRLQSGADYYLQGMISEHLENSERVELSRAYRSLREDFSSNPSVKSINEKLASTKGDISERALSLSIDISHRFTWESGLAPHLDDLPFQFVGKGEQHSLKVLLALNRKAEDAHVVLIEEPENHLSFSSLNILIAKVAEKCAEKQVLISTHSSYVLNKLGLENLILINRDQVVRIESLPTDTQDYFRKLSGYDTLRLVLAKKVILVEGPSDELIVQRAYRDAHGCLPIEDGVDVINVRGLSFRRFLDIAIRIERETPVVTDNDGASQDAVLSKYGDYTSKEFLEVCVSPDQTLKTLEPQLLAAIGRDELNAIFGTSYADDDAVLVHMKANKTSCALSLFMTERSLTWPDYIAKAVAF